MAENVKITELDELVSGSLKNDTIFPVVDADSTQKVSLLTLTEYIDDFFASNSQLDNQISILSTDISNLNTSDIAESGSLYYTDTRVKNKLNVDGIVSSSSQIDLSSTTNYISGIKTRLDTETVISSSTQIAELGFVSESINSVSASYAITASYAENIENQQIDYISNIGITGSVLDFTAEGLAFTGSIDLNIDGNLTTTSDLNGYLDTASYNIDSSSFASRIDSSEFDTSGTNIVSSSEQILLSQADADGYSTDNITQGAANLYYSNQLVKDYLNTEEVLSGSVEIDTGGTGILSGSQQITDLGFATTESLNQTASQLQSDINEIESFNPNESYEFTSQQTFFGGIVVTGNVLLSNGSYSGSGANLSNIPASAIVGGETTNTISDGNTSVVADSFNGVELNSGDGDILANGNIIIENGSNISGNGSGLTDIPTSAIVGGGASDRIVSASFSASFNDSDEFIVNTDGIFLGNLNVTNDIIANSTNVAKVSTNIIESDGEMILSASSRVTVKDVPLNLSGLSDADTGSFTLSDGDIVFSDTSNDFYGYRMGAWVSLTNGGSDTTLNSGVISSSVQIAELGASIVSSSTQIVSDYNLSINEIPFLYESNSVEGVSDMFTGSSNFTFDPTNDLLSVGGISTTDITFDGDLTGVGFSTASFKLLLADSIGINTQYQLPTTDGIANQVIASDGSGNTSFQSIDTLIADSDLTTTGTITAGTASVTTDLTVDGTINDQTISSTALDYQAQAVRLRSSGELILSSSSDEFGVQIDNVLVLPPRDTKPTTPPTGSIIVSASVSGPRPFFYDGTDWTQMF